MKMVGLLKSHGIIPVLVFDGKNVPSKKGTETDRREYVYFPTNSFYISVVMFVISKIRDAVDSVTIGMRSPGLVVINLT
jgi:hypothetical protein